MMESYQRADTLTSLIYSSPKAPRIYHPAGPVLPGDSFLPVRQVLRANRAANTAARPSSGVRILATAPGTDTERGDRATGEQADVEEEKEKKEKADVAVRSRFWSSLHPLAHEGGEKSWRTRNQQWIGVRLCRGESNSLYSSAAVATELEGKNVSVWRKDADASSVFSKRLYHFHLWHKTWKGSF